MPARFPLRHLPGYLFFRVAVAGVQALPLTWGCALGSWLGAWTWRLLPWVRPRVRRNLRIAFGRETSAAALENLAREHFRRLGANLLGGIKAAALSPEELARHVEVEIHPASRRQPGEHVPGYVAMVSHQGNWELFPHLGFLFPETQIGAVYQPLENPLIDRYVQAVRHRQGMRLFSRQDGFLQSLAFIRGGGCLAVLIDQHAGDGGVWTPFFDRLASTSPLAATLARRSGTRLLPVAVQTIGPARWKVVIGAYLHPLLDEEPEPLTARMNVLLEAQIRQSPADWLWGHDRWKTPRPRFLLGTYPRGTAFPPDYAAERLQPFRVGVWVDDFAAAPAIRAMRTGRPDLLLTLCVPQTDQAAWKTLVPGLAVVALEEIRRATLPIELAILLVRPAHWAATLHRWRIPHRVGFHRPEQNRWLTQRVAYGGGLSRRQRFLKLAETIGAVPEKEPAVSPLAPDERARVWAGARPCFVLRDLAAHLELLTEPGTVPSINPAGLLEIRSTFHSVRCVLHRLRLPSEHRLLVRIVCERPYNDWLHLYYLTDTGREFEVARSVTQRDLPPGLVEVLLELPPADFSGSLCLVVGRGPADYLVRDLEIRAVPVRPCRNMD